MGHNMGMTHDSDEQGAHPPGGPCDKPSNIMFPSLVDSTIQWSTCSKKDFQAHYIFITNLEDWCLEGRLK